MVSRDDKQARLASQTPEISLNYRNLNVGVQGTRNVQEISTDRRHVEGSRVCQQPIELLQTIVEIGNVEDFHGA